MRAKLRSVVKHPATRTFLVVCAGKTVAVAFVHICGLGWADLPLDVLVDCLRDLF